MKTKARPAIALFALTMMAVPCGAQETDMGAYEYRNSCASCHGAKGNGNGPLAELLKVAMPDLTMLAKNNNGVFPMERVHQIVDGRLDVKAHGPREMPVWGSRYERETSGRQANEFTDEATLKRLAKARIIAIIDYLYRIQAK